MRNMIGFQTAERGEDDPFPARARFGLWLNLPRDKPEFFMTNLELVDWISRCADDPYVMPLSDALDEVAVSNSQRYIAIHMDSLKGHPWAIVESIVVRGERFNVVAFTRSDLFV